MGRKEFLMQNPLKMCIRDSLIHGGFGIFLLGHSQHLPCGYICKQVLEKFCVALYAGLEAVLVSHGNTAFL